MATASNSAAEYLGPQDIARMWEPHRKAEAPEPDARNIEK